MVFKQIPASEKVNWDETSEEINKGCQPGIGDIEKILNLESRNYLFRLDLVLNNVDFLCSVQKLLRLLEQNDST